MNIKLHVLIYILAFSLAACSENDSSSIELSGINYTNNGIAMFSVDNYGGHGIEPNAGGGAFVCCVTIPREWRADMKITVQWTQDGRVPGPLKKRIVDVPRYTKQDIGAFVVHFYPDNIVKVLVTTKILGHPDYPYPRPN